MGKNEVIAVKEQVIAVSKKEIAAKEQVITAKEQEIAYLNFRINELNRMCFGAKRERFISKIDPAQLELFQAPTEEEIEKETEKVEITYERSKPKKKHPGREKLPECLPVRETVIEPKEKVEGMVKIGEEVTDQLGCDPAVFYIKRTIRPKYITPADEKGNQKQVIAELNLAISKCMADTTLLAAIMVDKYVFHMPLHRQLKRFIQMGVHISPSTVDSWMSLSYNLLRPLYAALKLEVMKSFYLQTDESPIHVRDHEKKGKLHLGYMWVYHPVLIKAVLFNYQKGRSQIAPKEMLTDFKGFLQTDGYDVYDFYGEKEDITHLGCWAHARRYFEKALGNDPERATEVLKMIQQLYAVEREARENNMSHEQRHELRLKKSLPVLNDIGNHVFTHVKTALPKSPIGKAYTYCFNQWDKLMNYLKEGFLEIDNNLVENAIRPLTLGRKNYLFAGSHNGARYAEMFYSFFATCAKNNINYYDWLLYVMENINDTKKTELINLLPHHIDPKLLQKTEPAPPQQER